MCILGMQTVFFEEVADQFLIRKLNFMVDHTKVSCPHEIIWQWMLLEENQICILVNTRTTPHAPFAPIILIFNGMLIDLQIPGGNLMNSIRFYCQILIRKCKETSLYKVKTRFWTNLSNEIHLRTCSWIGNAFRMLQNRLDAGCPESEIYTFEVKNWSGNESKSQHKLSRIKLSNIQNHCIIMCAPPTVWWVHPGCSRRFYTLVITK